MQNLYLDIDLSNSFIGSSQLNTEAVDKYEALQNKYPWFGLAAIIGARATLNTTLDNNLVSKAGVHCNKPIWLASYLAQNKINDTAATNVLSNNKLNIQPPLLSNVAIEPFVNQIVPSATVVTTAVDNDTKNSMQNEPLTLISLQQSDNVIDEAQIGINNKHLQQEELLLEPRNQNILNNEELKEIFNKEKLEPEINKEPIPEIVENKAIEDIQITNATSISKPNHQTLSTPYASDTVENLSPMEAALAMAEDKENETEENKLLIPINQNIASNNNEEPAELLKPLENNIIITETIIKEDEKPNFADNIQLTDFNNNNIVDNSAIALDYNEAMQISLPKLPTQIYNVAASAAASFAKPLETERNINDIKVVEPNGLYDNIANTKENEITFEPYHTVDYFAAVGIKIDDKMLQNDRIGMQLRSFSEWLKTMKNLHPDKLISSSLPHDAPLLEIKTLDDEEVITEAMSIVYLKQGRKDKAVELLAKLSLLNPSKTAYFANLIQDYNNK